MAMVNAYIPQPTQLMFETDEGQRVASGCIEFGGWNHREKSLAPIHVEALSRMPGAPALTWVLDSLAAAAEAGRLDADRYIEQLFASKSDLRDFRLMLRDAGADAWVNDRHHNAVRKLGNAEFDVSTYPGMANIFDPA
ncbi:hypothetical protein FAZ95_03145 [Trinickia violacea]|uniref:Uncharacterized protein n=1 Tax=Trinickia violacea TaxID=2571746 RepID=A0A4P8IN27_9BURK|nr:hypothetical protein [Trinickia violacea]QCP48273.1 hypothetical protein FAZ95_03145 [Trinickia violacea]